MGVLHGLCVQLSFGHYSSLLSVKACGYANYFLDFPEVCECAATGWEVCWDRLQAHHESMDTLTFNLSSGSLFPFHKQQTDLPIKFNIIIIICIILLLLLGVFDLSANSW